MTKSRKSAGESNGPTRASVIASGERSIAIDTQGGPFLGVANSGDHTTIVHVPPHELRPPASVDAPPGVVRLPALHASFVGRARELALLDEALTGSGAAVVQAVHGLGGIGKSTLAAHWAGARREVDNPVWWITADSSGALATGLAALAAALQPALARLPQDQLKERALQWLATHDGWLLILDNVTDPEDVQPLLAHADKGRILITSRRASGWHDTAEPIHLDTLTPDEAHTLLTRILTGDATRAAADLDGAAELCAEVGYLPLAIEQVGAPTSSRPASPHAPTCACSQKTLPTCTARRRKGTTANAPSPGSGPSPWTASPTRPWPGTCCASWPGTPPTPSHARSSAPSAVSPPSSTP